MHWGHISNNCSRFAWKTMYLSSKSGARRGYGVFLEKINHRIYIYIYRGRGEGKGDTKTQL